MVPGLGYFKQWDHPQEAQKCKKHSIQQTTERTLVHPLFVESWNKVQHWFIWPQLGVYASGASNFSSPGNGYTWPWPCHKHWGYKSILAGRPIHKWFRNPQRMRISSICICVLMVSVRGSYLFSSEELQRISKSKTKAGWRRGLILAAFNIFFSCPLATLHKRTFWPLRRGQRTQGLGMR